MMRSLCLWNFIDFAHGQIYSSGSPDMEWPTSNFKMSEENVICLRLPCTASRKFCRKVLPCLIAWHHKLWECAENGSCLGHWNSLRQPFVLFHTYLCVSKHLIHFSTRSFSLVNLSLLTNFQKLFTVSNTVSTVHFIKRCYACSH